MRLNGIVLFPAVRNGRVVLTAILPDGSEQVLASGQPVVRQGRRP